MSEPKQGDFYISQDDCVSTLCCAKWGPELFAHQGKASFVKKQPENDHELMQMFQASRDCVVDCISYRGDDPSLKQHFLLIHDCRHGFLRKRCKEGKCPCFNTYIKERDGA